MEITDVTVDRYRFERTVGRQSAVKEATHSTSLLITVEADGTVTGTGEVPDIEEPGAIPPTGEIESALGEILRSRDPRRINALNRDLPGEIAFGPEQFHSFQQLTLGAIDAALYDLLGNHRGVPAYQLLGGKTQDVPLCWVVFSGDDDLSGMRAEVTEKVDQGFQSFKLKVGEQPPEVDERRIRAVRETAGEGADVFLDAQGVWGPTEAVDRIGRFAEAGIDGVETPVGHPDESVDAPGYYYDAPLLPEEIAAVRERVDVPILEHVLDPAFGIELIRHDAVDVFTAEVCAVGITRTEQILRTAQSAGIDARLGSTVEFGPATLAGASLAAASPAVTYPSDLIGPLAYDESVLSDPVEYDRGSLAPRDRPGFGIAV